MKRSLIEMPPHLRLDCSGPADGITQLSSLKGTGHFSETLSVGGVPGTDHS